MFFLIQKERLAVFKGELNVVTYSNGEVCIFHDEHDNRTTLMQLDNLEQAHFVLRKITNHFMEKGNQFNDVFLDLDFLERWAKNRSENEDALELEEEEEEEDALELEEEEEEEVRP